MPVTFHIPRALREFTAGEGAVTIQESPATVGEALSVLWTLYPGVRDRVATEQGEIRQHVNVFVGDENIRYTGGLSSPVVDGCSISIVPAVSGGSERSERFRSDLNTASVHSSHAAGHVTDIISSLP